MLQLQQNYNIISQFTTYNLTTKIIGELSGISDSNHLTPLPQLPVQPLWNTDRPPVHDQRRGRPAAAAALHHNGRASACGRLLGEKHTRV